VPASCGLARYVAGVAAGHNPAPATEDKFMKVVADLCIVPMGVGPSVSPYVREIKTILETSGLDAEMHANGTNIEGELADICRLIELCEERLSQIGVQRVFYTMAFSSRRDKAQSMADKLIAVS
jgi:uncharacterized protein (TIGR00106 family)